MLGGGFGGVTAARHLEKLCRADITLVSRDNFFVLSPLLFEACSGTLELRHCAQGIRPALRRARFVEATVTSVDIERRVVHTLAPEAAPQELPYDQLIVALGATTNLSLVPGSRHAFTVRRRAVGVPYSPYAVQRYVCFIAYQEGGRMHRGEANRPAG